MKELLDRLSKVQAKLKAPKRQFNSFGKYNYRSAEDILEAVKPLLKENGLTMILSDTAEVIGDWNYIKATATVYFEDLKIEASAYAREASTKKGMDDSQITGTASSYARKYALNGLFNIDDTKDADTQDNRKPEISQTHIKKAIKKLNQAKDLEELKSTLLSFGRSLALNPEIQKAKDKVKAKLS